MEVDRISSRIKTMNDWPPTIEEALDKLYSIAGYEDEVSKEETSKIEQNIIKSYRSEKRITKPCLNKKCQQRNTSSIAIEEAYLSDENALGVHWDMLFFSGSSCPIVKKGEVVNNYKFKNGSSLPREFYNEHLGRFHY